MNLLVTVIVSVLMVEVLFYLPLLSIAFGIYAWLERSLRVVTAAHISDHWKEKVLLHYSGRIAASTAQLCAVLVFSLLALLGMVYVLDMVLGVTNSTFVYLLTPTGMLVAIAVAVVHLKIRGSVLH